MKITRKEEPRFEPVKVYLKSQEEVNALDKLRRSKFIPVSIVLESQEEVDLVYSIFNFTPISECFNGNTGDLAGRLQKGLSCIRSENYQIYHRKLNDKLEYK